MTIIETTYAHGLSAYMNAKCRCDVCREAKSANDLAYREKNAEKIAAKKHAHYLANQDQMRAKSVDRRASRTPEQREAAAQYHREWAAKAYVNGRPRSEATKERRRQWDAENAEEIAAKARAYRKENATKRRDWEAARRARMAASDVRVVLDSDWRRMVARYRGCCAYCGEFVEGLTQDHIIPLARGGRHSIGNLIPACGSCNSSKNARLIVEWTKRTT